jgi:pimeloyl-ACP methyl ester carboxylesterase
LSYPYPELPRREIEALGIRTSYVFAGQPDTPLVVMLHGTVSSGDAYREVMHELADEFWLIAPDLPGFGFSEDTEPYTLPHLVEWLASFGEALDLPPMMLVGHSFGGALATSYTISYPEDVARLLLVAPAILASDLLPDYLKRLGFALRLADLGAALSQSPTLVEYQSGRSFYDPDAIHESVWPRRLKAVSQSRAAGGVLKALAFQNMAPQLCKVRQPVCIIWGKDDPVLPAAQAEQIAGTLPDAQVVIWDECGHLPFLEKPQQFLATARIFFRGE